jgi:hypothetical protein
MTIAVIDISTTPSLTFIKPCPFDIRIYRSIPNPDESELKIEYLWMSLRSIFCAGTLTGCDTFAFTLDRALAKVNGFAASVAGVSPIKFIRKYLFFFAALGTFARDYLEIFKICIPGTMLRR